jgi:hypothetical protein
MPDLKITHQSVHDYIAAKKRGDRATTDRILRRRSVAQPGRPSQPGSSQGRPFHPPRANAQTGNRR